MLVWLHSQVPTAGAEEDFYFIPGGKNPIDWSQSSEFCYNIFTIFAQVILTFVFIFLM